MTIGLDSDSYFEKEGDIYKIYKFREFYAFSKIYGTEDTIHYRYRKNDFPLEKYGTYGVHVDSGIPLPVISIQFICLEMTMLHLNMLSNMTVSLI